MRNKKDLCRKIVKTMFGSLLYAISINIFISPNKLLSGGVAGMSLMLQYITKIPSGYFVFIINIPIFIIGYKLMDKEFIFLSFIGMMSMAAFLIITKNFSYGLRVNDIVISTVFGAVLNGIGMGIIFRAGATQGGTDIIAFIIRKNKGIKLSTLYFCLNGAIAVSEIFIADGKLMLYTVALMYLTSKVMDKIIVGFNRSKILMVITFKDKEISRCIRESTGRDVMYLSCEDLESSKNKKIIYCTISENQLFKVKELVNKIDFTAKMSVSEVM